MTEIHATYALGQFGAERLHGLHSRRGANSAPQLWIIAHRAQVSERGIVVIRIEQVAIDAMFDQLGESDVARAWYEGPLR